MSQSLKEGVDDINVPDITRDMKSM